MSRAATGATVTRDTRAAFLVLEHAERIGLPMPDSVLVADYLGAIYGATIDLAFPTLADLTDWARWMEVTVEETPGAGCVLFSATGDALGAQVRCVAVTS